VRFQYLTSRRNGFGARHATLHFICPMVLLLGILSIPFNSVYGWQIVTRLQPASSAVRGTRMNRSPEPGEPSGVKVASPYQIDVGVRNEGEGDESLNAEPQGSRQRQGGARDELIDSTFLIPHSAFGLSPAARILFAGLLANLT